MDLDAPEDTPAPGTLPGTAMHGRMKFVMGNMTIRIPHALRKELRELGRKQNRPVSEVVRDSLRRYVAGQRFQELRERAIPFAEAQGLLTDEDVFEAIS
jgi:predicted transcriptional regulator